MDETINCAESHRVHSRGQNLCLAHSQTQEGAARATPGSGELALRRKKAEVAALLESAASEEVLTAL